MNEKIPYWLSVGLSTLALVLLLINITILNSNRAAQLDVNQRQATIAGGQQMNQLNQILVQAMAEAALKNNNTQLRDLLSAQGYTLKTEPAPAAKSTEKK
ncbi:MAG: hypothetical protein WCD70_11085 [Alphaproteobacteria bacterium]